MDNPSNPLFSWSLYCQAKGMDELKQSLLMCTLELEATRLRVQEELKIRDDQLAQLRDLLNRAIKERDEAQDKCQTLLLEKFFLEQLHHQTGPLSGVSSIEDEMPRRGLDSNNGFSSSESDESIVSSPALDPIPPPQLPPEPEQEFILPAVTDKPLPEKGKLLQAVMNAGPLLQTLLLAGPLPQWRHPPPPIESYQIPPPPLVVPSPAPPPPTHVLSQDSLISLTSFNNDSGRLFGKKRAVYEASDYSKDTNYKRIFSH